ncbi:MAG: hypothetical protein JSV91_00960 [Phycisphaerales bacterium]|nr:MAG: hypothetical protein JSV91_00960 [Phycisphaerales bacterium]
MHEVIAQLEQLRRRSRALLVGQRVSVLLACVLGAVLALVLLDYALHLPPGARLLLLAGCLAAFIWAVVRYMQPAVTFSPTLVQLALRVECWIPALSGRLASSVEFSLTGSVHTNPLAARCVRETQRRLTGRSVMTVIDGRRTWRSIAILVGVGVIAGALTMAFPDSARIGTSRLFLPLGATAWPARTGVASLMHQVVGDRGIHPRGRVLPLRARVTKGPADQRVTARYRLETDGSYQAWRTILLTHQTAGVHERLIDTEAEALQVQFRTEDARTEVQRIGLIPPPEVIRARLDATPPGYAVNRRPATQFELGPGTDDRAISAPALLVGSDVRIHFELNAPLPVPNPQAAATREEWLHRTFAGLDGDTPQLAIDESRAHRWTLRWRLAETRLLSLTLFDEHGLSNPEPITYRIRAFEDSPPDVAITEPAHEEAVLATAVITLSAEARDDVALERIGLEANVLHAAESAAEEAAADVRDPPEPSPDWSVFRDVDAAGAAINEDLDLVLLELREGDELLIEAVARDGFLLDDAVHAPTRSGARRFRIVSPAEMARLFRAQLAAVRQNAIRIEAVQAQLQEELDAEGIQPGLDHAQARLRRRIADQGISMDEIDARSKRNRLEDLRLAELLRRSEDLLADAGDAAGRAVEAIEQSEETYLIVQAQQNVRDELTALIELLDRDEDTWVITRRLEALLDSQIELEERTRDLSGQTLGRTPEELDGQLRVELDRLVAGQTALGAEALESIQELRRRAKAMSDMDAQSAAGMRAAADTAERRGLPADMESAADQIARNRLQRAAGWQQSAAQTLGLMLEDLQEAKRAQAEELLRRLSSLLESIRRLITAQQRELEALETARTDQAFAGRDSAMIRLRQNTLSVAGQAREMASSTRRVATVLNRAGDAQQSAVVALRGQPADADAAREAEERSLRLLEEAESLAAALEQQIRDEIQRKQREELVDAYLNLAEREILLQEDTLRLTSRLPLDRRGLMDARRLANRQEGIRLELARLGDETAELAEAAVFGHVHRLIDRWARSVSNDLDSGDATGEVADRQYLIADSLSRLAEALQEALTPPEEFADEQTGGGGGGVGAQPLIPPVAEIKLLRGLQEQIYNQTRTVDARQDLEAESRRARLREIGRRQRDLLELSRAMLEKLGSSSPETESGEPAEPDIPPSPPGERR